MSLIRHFLQWFTTGQQDDQPLARIQEELSRVSIHTEEAAKLQAETAKLQAETAKLQAEAAKLQAEQEELAKGQEQLAKGQEQLAKEIAKQKEEAAKWQVELVKVINDRFQQLSSRQPSAKAVSFSQVGSSVAHEILSKLNVKVRDGHLVEPLTASGIPLPDFSMADFAGEHEATPSAMNHIKRCLELHSVKFDSDGFSVLDVHANKQLYTLTVEETMFRGGTDIVIVPFGIMETSASAQLRCAIELKHSSMQKALYWKNKGAPMPENPSRTTFSGTVEGQAYIETLAACVYAEYPEVMLLLTDIDFNTLTCYKSGKITCWRDISFSNAICKMAEFLNRCSTSIDYSLDTILTSLTDIPEAEVEALKQTQQLRKKIKGDDAFLEQLESVMDSGMSASERFAVALEFIRAYQPCDGEPSVSNSWQSMYG